MATDDYWIDAGRPELYLQANLDLVTRRPADERSRRRSHRGAVVARRRHGDDEPWSGPARAVGAGATVDRRSVLLPGAVSAPAPSSSDSIVAGDDRRRSARLVSRRGRRRRQDCRP